MRKIIFILIITLLIGGCSNFNKSSSSYIKDLIEQNINNDIFLFNGRVYKSTENIDWVKETELTPKEHIGTISKKYESDAEFEEEMATKLPIGAKIYSTVEKKGPLIIVILNGKILKYLAIMEG